MRENKEFSITVKNGLYIGDLCYMCNDGMYNFWGEQGYKDGSYEYNGLQFAMVGTAYGDGTYNSNVGAAFYVDAGIIGIADLSLVVDENFVKSCGLLLKEVKGLVSIKYDNGTIIISYDKEQIMIFTGDEEEYDDDESWY